MGKKGKQPRRAQGEKTTALVPGARGGKAAYPKHSLGQSLRIPQAILDNNGGKACSPREAAAFAKVGWSGPVGVEISSASKFGLLERPEPGKIKPTDLARQILRPHNPQDNLAGLRQAILTAPVVSDLYKRYRDESLPERQFIANTAVENYGVPKEDINEFLNVFLTSLNDAKLLPEGQPGGTQRVLNVTGAAEPGGQDTKALKDLSKSVSVDPTDRCFVLMPFADPLGGYYETIYKPAIEKAKLKAIRADDIFGAGKIIVDQIWRGINEARVLIADLTGRNPNVLYELGLAHAIKKPVVLVSAGVADVPFDVQHVRVINYDRNDPFWGTKLIEKIAENVLSALKTPDEAILFRDSNS